MLITPVRSQAAEKNFFNLICKRAKMIMKKYGECTSNIKAVSNSKTGARHQKINVRLISVAFIIT